MHNAAILSQEIANLRAANEKVIKKRKRSTRQIPCDEGLTVQEGLQLAQQANQLVEVGEVVSHAQGETPNQADQPATRARPKCSGCGQVGHRINSCKSRQI